MHVSTWDKIAFAAGVSIAACGGPSEDEIDARSSAQRLVHDSECSKLAGIPMVSVTHDGGDDGTVDLGGGATATITGANGVSFSWTSTRPIDILWVRGSNKWAAVFPFDPPAESGGPHAAPKDPDDANMQLPLTSVKFCFRADSVDGGIDGGADASDAGDASDAAGEAGDASSEGGGKTW